MILKKAINNKVCLSNNHHKNNLCLDLEALQELQKPLVVEHPPVLQPDAWNLSSWRIKRIVTKIVTVKVMKRKLYKKKFWLLLFLLCLKQSVLQHQQV